MRHRAPILAAALAVTLTAAPPLRAQRPIELGADLAASLAFNSGNSAFIAQTPVTLRFGIPVGGGGSVEPRVQFQLASGGGETVTHLDLTPALLLQIGRKGRHAPYLVLLPELAFISGGGAGSTTQFGAGAGLGTRLGESERFGFRVEAQYVRAISDKGLIPPNAISLLFGVSFFSR